MGRQHQGMDRIGVRQVPEGSGEQGKMEKTGCKIICGAPTTLVVKGLMMMMMMNILFLHFEPLWVFQPRIFSHAGGRYRLLGGLNFFASVSMIITLPLKIRFFF